MNSNSAQTIRLVLGDQLNPQHSWYREARSDVVYLMMEVRQETDYVLHHAQKILAIFAGMREFARHLQEAGHRVHFLKISDPANRHTLPANLDFVIALYGARRLEYQAPDEWRLDQQLSEYARQQEQSPQPVVCRAVDSEHFYAQRAEAAQLFPGRKKWLMEHFYRHMRTQHRVLLDKAGKPEGGQWNYDQENRQSWPGLPVEPADFRPRHDHSALWAEIVAAGVGSFGEPNAAQFAWPLNREEALRQLHAFAQHALPHFGEFQDAMSFRSWRLFHSLLSFALNTKMLNPAEVVNRVEEEWRAGRVPLAAAEGYIRQILGWREYVRGVYWANMPGYEKHNVFEHDLPLPIWFWTGKTKMRCVASAITQSLEQAHAHHIQRLMIIGNFALLAGLHPEEVHRWYLGIYIDAFEWVELPNTLGMSQFADGGLMATKPYVSSAAYINRMSDYCKGCHYDKKQREGETACPYNALYWNFFERNREKLAANHRLGMVYRQLEKMDATAIASLQTHAAHLRSNLDKL